MQKFLIYPHQLFKKVQILKNYEVVLIEEPLFFTQYPFHSQKLILHRASMRQYFTYLKSCGIKVSYIEVKDAPQFYLQGGEAVCYDVADDWIERKIRSSFSKIQILKSPNFLNCDDDATTLHLFYIHRRKEMGLWIEGNKPFGGKWSFDNENRKKLPKIINLPQLKTYDNLYIQEARRYIKNFTTTGEAKELFVYDEYP